MEFSLNFVNGFLKISLTCSQLQCKKMPVLFFVFVFKQFLLSIYFQYSVPGFIILEWVKSREWVLSTLVGQMRLFDLLFGACSKHVPKRSCIWIFCLGGHEDYLSLNDVQIILQGVTKNPKIEPFSNGSQLYLSLRKVTLKR